jgi:lipopolysaccharide export system protein LptA
LEKFPKDPEEDKTLYLLGMSFLELDQWEKAEVAFRKIVAEYPKSSHYKEARAILDKGLTEKGASLRKTKKKDSKKEDRVSAPEPERIALVKFEEEGKQPISLKEEKRVDLGKEERRLSPPPATGEPVKAIPPKKETKKPPPMTIEPGQEDRAHAVPPSVEAKETAPVLPVEPMKESRSPAPPPLPSEKMASKMEVKPDEEKRMAALPSGPTPSKGKEKIKKEVFPETNQAKVVDPADKSQPIDITSDKVEAYWKENLIIFKGNVIARQKDMVIYADSVEVVTIEDGKGIERVTAGGNVKIQQGLRVANCQKAVFYNLDQKVVLTGDPKVSEGDNIVLGDEIIFDIEKNRVEVKGGLSGRGKAKIQPGEIEKVK